MTGDFMEPHQRNKHRNPSKRRLLAAGFLAVVAFTGLWFLLKPKEPRHDGKTLSEWLAMGSKASRDNPAPEAARAAVRAIGIDAIPFLEARLRSKRTRNLLGLKSLMHRAGLRSMMGRPVSNDELSEALFGFETLGEADIPALKRILDSRDRSARHHAMLALGRLRNMAAAAVPELGEVLLADADAFLRTAAADTLGAIGSNEGIVGLLVKGLADEDASVRLHAALALGRFDEAAVLEQDFDAYMNLRWNGRFDGSVVATRGGIHTSATNAIPALTKATTDHNSSVRAAARFARDQIRTAVNKKNQP